MISTSRQTSAVGRIVLAAMVAVTLALPGLVAGVGGASVANAVSVIADEEAERFVGSGAVVLPSSISANIRHQASRCVGCRWKVTAPCLRDDEHSDAGCRGTVLGCPQGREISRAWFAPPGGDFSPVGLFCPSHGEVTSVVDATNHVRAGFERRIPPLRVSCAPATGVVVGIPLHCRSLQPSAHVTWVDSIGGYSVHTSATATWHWNFRQVGSGGTTTGNWVHTAQAPGSVYPGPGIQQGFTMPGLHLVDVRAVWRGTFSVDGLGPFPIDPGLEQRTRLEVPTGSALGVVRP